MVGMKFFRMEVKILNEWGKRIEVAVDALFSFGFFPINGSN